MGGRGLALRHGRMHAEELTLRRLIAVAYNLPEMQVIGPNWLTRDRFDLDATAPQGVPDSELRPMILHLLEERFGLKAHIEARTLPVYHLTVVKDGPKMPLVSAGLPPRHPPERNGVTSHFDGTTSGLTDPLSHWVERPVIDKTGLTGRYYFILHFTAPTTPPDKLPEFPAPDIFNALQQQLGLKLDSGKDDVSVIVVDHVEPTPTDN